ncbi:hypothetical protein [Microbacterium oleivorans]|uniref:Uncharacterized protein n=1 Tax=Microbacterium oleivorans TaxID=273677 RepID=A0A177KCG5_9MICO|nr:hypothetical protein [Microbacterium oleivorans]OAH50757.1 hypothetical protein AYL44_00250 [Microbacterium oleivorans]
MTQPDVTVSGEPWLTGHVIDAADVRSEDGEGALVRAGRIVDEIEARLVDARGDEPDGELIPGTPLLRRGEVSIVPLSWEPPTSDEIRAAVRERASELWRGIRSACEYRHGVALAVEPGDGAPPNAYVRALQRHGVRRADWWGSDDRAIVLVVHGEPLPAPASASAVHIVPLGWLSTTRPTRRIPPVDLTWSPATDGRGGDG